MSKLTEAAREMPCTVRVPGHCNYNPQTTVAAHYRSVRLGAGTGIKPHDLLCAHACSSCHDVIDGRVTTHFTRDELRLMHLEGVAETIVKLIRLGKVKA
jgi:hypothetical protein